MNLVLGHPGYLCGKALCMGRLEAVPLHLIGILAEGAIWLVFEDLIEFFPVVVHHLIVRRNHVLKVLQLQFLDLALVDVFPEVARCLT